MNFINILVALLDKAYHREVQRRLAESRKLEAKRARQAKRLLELRREAAELHNSVVDLGTQSDEAVNSAYTLNQRRTAVTKFFTGEEA